MIPAEPERIRISRGAAEDEEDEEGAEGAEIRLSV